MKNILCIVLIVAAVLIGGGLGFLAGKDARPSAKKLTAEEYLNGSEKFVPPPVSSLDPDPKPPPGFVLDPVDGATNSSGQFDWSTAKVAQSGFDPKKPYTVENPVGPVGKYQLIQYPDMLGRLDTQTGKIWILELAGNTNNPTGRTYWREVGD